MGSGFEGAECGPSSRERRIVKKDKWPAIVVVAEGCGRSEETVGAYYAVVCDGREGKTLAVRSGRHCDDPLLCLPSA